MRMVGRGCSRIVSILFLVGCGAEPVPPGTRATVRDSAGIRIVENPSPEGVRAWRRTADQPALRIAPDGAGGPPLYQVTGAAVLADGRIALTDQGASAVRLFSPEGETVATLGAEGDGPGEFRQPTLVGVLPGDSLLVADVGARRLTVVHPDVGLVRTAAFPPDVGGFPLPQGALADGTVLLGGGFFFSPAAGGSPPTGVAREPTRYHTVRSDGTLRADLGEFPGLEMFFEVSASGMRATGLPFGRAPVAAAGAEQVWLGASDRYEIEARDADGSVVQIVRADVDPAPVRPVDVEAWREAQLADAADADERRAREARAARIPAAPTKPAYRTLLVDDDGRLWVSTFRDPGDDVPVYHVFGSDGVLLGSVTLPPRFRPWRATSTWVLGSRFDAVDQEVVERWGLSPP